MEKRRGGGCWNEGLVAERRWAGDRTGMCGWRDGWIGHGVVRDGRVGRGGGENVGRLGNGWKDGEMGTERG